MSTFTNDDLKAGMLVELKNGVLGILIPLEGGLEVFDKRFDAKTSAYLRTDNLDDIHDSYAIVKVYGLSNKNSLFNRFSRTLLWSYKEPRREMTLEQIESALGYPITIVERGEKE